MARFRKPEFKGAVFAILDGEQVLPGFEFPIAELFKEWDWD
jgi:hypothetical protein